MLKKKINTAGRSIAYQEYGEGPAILLVHGFLEDSRIWENQVDIFKGFRVLVPDLPGSGDSDPLEEVSVESLAESLKGLLDHLSIDKTVFIGHSMGGYIALAFAEKYPERLRGFALFHSTAFADDEAKRENRRKGIEFMQKHTMEEFLKTSLPKLYSEEFRKSHPDWVSGQISQYSSLSPASMIQYAKAMMNRPDRTPTLSSLPVPALFIMGSHDELIPVKDLLKQCYLPSVSYIHVLEQSAHVGMIEEADKANKILTDYVKRLD